MASHNRRTRKLPNEITTQVLSIYLADVFEYDNTTLLEPTATIRCHLVESLEYSLIIQAQQNPGHPTNPHPVLQPFATGLGQRPGICPAFRHPPPPTASQAADLDLDLTPVKHNGTPLSSPVLSKTTMIPAIPASGGSAETAPEQSRSEALSTDTGPKHHILMKRELNYYSRSRFRYSTKYWDRDFSHNQELIWPRLQATPSYYSEVRNLAAVSRAFADVVLHIAKSHLEDAETTLDRAHAAFASLKYIVTERNVTQVRVQAWRGFSTYCADLIEAMERQDELDVAEVVAMELREAVAWTEKSVGRSAEKG